MTFQQLEYILEIRRTGSISQAAKKFYVSQASISRAVNALERELGVQIFHRSWNGVQPTEQGCTVLEEANRICESWRRMSEGKNLSRREVRISMAGFRPMQNAFVCLLREFRDNDEVRISEVTIEEEDAAAKLAMFEAELCIINPVLETARSWVQDLRAKDMNCRIIGTIPAVIRISPAHPLYSAPNLIARDFQNERIIDRGRLASAEVIKPFLNVDYSKALLVDNHILRNRLMQEGFGYTVTYPLLRPTSNREIPLELRYAIIAVTNARRTESPEVLRFLELLEEELGERYGKASLPPDLRENG